MTRALFYDTETSGMPLWGQPSSDKAQPHLLQVCGLLVDVESRKTLQSVDLIVRPDGWSIDPESMAVHGITEAYAAEVGIPETSVLLALHELWQRADVRVGHVQSFDARMVRIALKRHGWGDRLADAWRDGRAECTKQLAKEYAPKLKDAGGYSLKNVHHYYLNTDFPDAHSARADTEACMAVYWAIRDHSSRAERRKSPKPAQGVTP